MVHMYTGFMWEQIKKRSNNPTYKDNEDNLEGDDYVFKQEYKSKAKLKYIECYNLLKLRTE